jgi:hypothetical protein
MKKLFIHKTLRAAFGSLVAASLLGSSAHATLYSFNSPDSADIPSGYIPQDGSAFSSTITVSSISIPSPYITSFQLILNFQDNASLTGTGSGIQGLLTLGTGMGSPFLSFKPTAATPSGPSYVYDVTFTGAPGTPGSGFYGLNPNDTWGLVLWDTSESGMENYLTGWSLNITAVPEPVNVALGVFGLVLVGTVGIRRYRQQKQQRVV